MKKERERNVTFYGWIPKTQLNVMLYNNVHALIPIQILKLLRCIYTALGVISVFMIIKFYDHHTVVTLR